MPGSTNSGGSAAFRWRVATFYCLKCGYEWVKFDSGKAAASRVSTGQEPMRAIAAPPRDCPNCGALTVSDPIYVGRVKRMFELLEDDHRSGAVQDQEYEMRKKVLTELYLKSARATVKDATGVFQKSYADFLSARFGNDLFARLVYLLHCFDELGMTNSAAACGEMLGVGFALRGLVRDVHALEDLEDLRIALGWFEVLRREQWQASLHAGIGCKAGSVVEYRTIRDYGKLIREGKVHLERAEEMYRTLKEFEFMESAGRKKDRLERLLPAIIRAEGNLESAEEIARGLRDKGKEIGDGLREGLGELGRFIAHGLAEVALGIRDAGRSIGFGLESGLERLGRNIQTGMELQAKATFAQAEATFEAGRRQALATVQAGNTQALAIAEGSEALGKSIALGLLGGGVLGSAVMRNGIMHAGDAISAGLSHASGTLADAPMDLLSTGLELLLGAPPQR